MINHNNTEHEHIAATKLIFTHLSYYRNYPMNKKQRSKVVRTNRMTEEKFSETRDNYGLPHAFQLIECLKRIRTSDEAIGGQERHYS